MKKGEGGKGRRERGPTYPSQVLPLGIRRPDVDAEADEGDVRALEPRGVVVDAANVPEGQLDRLVVDRDPDRLCDSASFLFGLGGSDVSVGFVLLTMRQEFAIRGTKGRGGGGRRRRRGLVYSPWGNVLSTCAYFTERDDRSASAQLSMYNELTKRIWQFYERENSPKK